MPRRTKEDALKTRQLLIESAIQQFALRGVTSTTLADIADAAGVTRGAVYWHFASKAELFNEMWQQQLPLRDLLQHEFNLKDDQDPLSTLREKFIIGLQYIANNRIAKTNSLANLSFRHHVAGKLTLLIENWF